MAWTESGLDESGRQGFEPSNPTGPYHAWNPYPRPLGLSVNRETWTARPFDLYADPYGWVARCALCPHANRSRVSASTVKRAAYAHLATAHPRAEIRLRMAPRLTLQEERDGVEYIPWGGTVEIAGDR